VRPLFSLISQKGAETLLSASARSSPAFTAQAANGILPETVQKLQMRNGATDIADSPALITYFKWLR